MADEGAVTVCVRVRPLISREQDLGDAAQLHWKTEERLISQTDGTRSFSFDRVFHSNETTEKVYEEMAVPIIRSAIQGYNGTIFAYGQTASGKTYTMMGSADGLGVIPKAINDIFIKIKEIPEREFLLRVSYMEIYNETITDLLCDSRKRKPLEIREDFNRNVYVADLTEEVVSTPELTLQWIKKGERNRKTKMSQRSTRSHTIFRMILESREKGDAFNSDGAVMVSHLDLVDLAGSERDSQTGSEGVWLEGCNNRSLCILGQVIQKLSDGQSGGFINYRDSKLTQILQNSLGGNAKTLIICTITPLFFDETLSTLQFASTAKYMKNTPRVNEVLDDEALLKRYQQEIIDLKKQLEEIVSETHIQTMEKDQLALLLEEKDLLQKVQNDKVQNLAQMLVTSSSITLQQDLKVSRRENKVLNPILEKAIEQAVSELPRKNLKDLDTQEELEIAQMCQKEYRQTIDKLEEFISEKEASEKTIAILQKKIQELEAKREQTFSIRGEVNEVQEKMNEIEQLKELLKSKESTLERIEMENLELAQKLQASLEETTSVTEERDELAKTQEALHRERDQLKEAIRDLIAKDQETKEELKFAEMCLKEHEETIDMFEESILEKTDQVSKSQEALEKTNAELQEKIQELQEQKEQVFNSRKEVTEAQEKVNEVEHLKEQLKSRDSTLERIEMESLELAQKLQASLEETTSVTEERDELRKTQEALHRERDQLKETIRDLIAKDLEMQEKLKVAQMDLKEHRDTMDKLKECISEKEAIKKTSAELQEKIQKLEAKQEQIFNVREEDSEAKEKMKENELKASVEETTSVTEERDELTKTQEALHKERDQLKETIRDLVAKDQETQEELKFAEMCLKEHQETIHKLKECISEKTTQVSKSQEALEKTNAGLQEKILKLQETEEMLLSVGKEVNETKLQKQTLCQLVERLIQTLSAVETARLDLTQKLDSSLSKMNTIIEERDALKETEKALLMEVSHLKESLKKSGALDQQYLKKLINNVENPRTDFKQFHLENFKRKYLHIKEVLRCVIEMKRDHHNTIHKFEMNLIEEAERQNDFFIKIQHLQQHSEIKSQILSGYKKLCQKMDLHIVQILKDVLETQNFINDLIDEFQGLLNAKKIILFSLVKWAQVDERSLSIIQKENERIFQKQNLFLNKITFLVKESSEFAKRSVAVYNDWELELRQMKNKNEEMLKKFQTVKTTLLPLHDPGPLTVGENKKHLKTTKKVTFNLTNDPTKGEFQFHRGTDEWKKERSETSAE
ncbi:uncharacterized protein LOC110223091 [Phascolarctos cinereus]